MQNFTYHNPTKIIFGKETISRIGPEALPYGKRALLVYGKGSIKKNGVYDTVLKSLKEAGITFFELPGVKANPVLSHAREGIALAKRENVDMIIAVGGGSVIDESKGIAAGACSDTDVWKFYMKEASIEKAIPILSVLTMAATGSEMNGGTVLSNEETNVKIGLGSPFLYPKVSILDPETLFSIPSEQTAYGCVDAMTHLLESYLTGSDRFTPLQDRYVEGIVKTLVEIAPKMLASPRDYALRATFMWGATMAWNGTAPSGVGDWGTPNHLIGHSMSSYFDTPHGASLSITLSGYLPYYAKTRPERIEQLGKAVFEISGPDAAEKTIEALKDWFRKIGSPVTLSEIGIDEEGFKLIVENAAEYAPLWHLPHMNKEVITEILERVKM